MTKLLPCDFSIWDKNHDSLIDEEEFAELVKLQLSGKDVQYAFQAADVDGVYTPCIFIQIMGCHI